MPDPFHQNCLKKILFKKAVANETRLGTEVTMFKKILFATTASPACDAAAKIAFEIAEKYESELILFHTYGVPSHDSSFAFKGRPTWKEESVSPDYIDGLEGELKNIYGALIEKHGIPEFQITGGLPSTEILRYAGINGVDCIIMGAHTREEEADSGRFRAIAGTTMQKVAQKACCPVLIISRSCDTCFWYFNKIIFGTDFSKASLSAFRFAFKMAETIGCKIYLFHAVDIEATQAGVFLGQKAIEDKINEARKQIKEEYVPVMGDFDNYEIAIWEGVPYVELLKFTRETSGDLIVMAHHTKETDPAEALLGTTAEQVILRSACPVAIVNRPA